MSPQMITGELRKWHRSGVVGKTGIVIGSMYNDIKAIWEDGDHAVIHYVDWLESPNHYTAITVGGGGIKCPKDEEIVNGNRAPPAD